MIVLSVFSKSNNKRKVKKNFKEVTGTKERAYFKNAIEKNLCLKLNFQCKNRKKMVNFFNCLNF